MTQETCYFSQRNFRESAKSKTYQINKIKALFTIFPISRLQQLFEKKEKIFYFHETRH
jgi:hypothetical protein